MRSFCRFRPDARRSFTLVEVLVAVAILAAVLWAVLQFLITIQPSWKSAATDPFSEAGSAFETISQNLAAATLEPYQDYADTNGAFRTNSTAAFTPDHLARRSDLAFVCGPSGDTNGLLISSGRTTAGCAVFFVALQGYTQTDAHAGLERLLNAIGYFVEFGNDANAPSFLLSSAQRWRWRLKQVRQPSESLQIYTLSSSSAWIQQLVPAGTSVPILAENIIALIILPERAASDSGATLSTDFRYDSRDATNPLTRHQLPPRLRLALVAIDEPSAKILSAQNGTNAPALIANTLFQEASKLDADLALLDASLTAQKIGHRFFQRTILLPAAAWSNTPSQ